MKKKKRVTVIGGIFLLALVPLLANAETPTEKDRIISVVNQFFTVLETRDVKLAEKILMTDGGYFSTRTKDNKQLIKYTTFKAMIESLPKSKENYKEVMANPRVLIDGDIAMLWTKYKFYVNGTVSHGGVDSFSLIKTETGWKIAGIIYNVIPATQAP